MKKLFMPYLKNILIVLVGYTLISFIVVILSPNDNLVVLSQISNILNTLLVLALCIGYFFYSLFYGKYATITRTLPTDKKSPFKTFTLYVIDLCFLIALADMILSFAIEYHDPLSFVYFNNSVFEITRYFIYVLFTSFCGYLLTVSALMFIISILYSNKFKLKNKYIIITIIALFCLLVSFWTYVLGMITNILSILISFLILWLTSLLYTKYGIIKN